MKSLFKKKSTPIVGLDIGTRYIKAVWLEEADSGFVLKGYACEAIGKDAFEDRAIKDYDAVNLTLRKVKNALKTKIKKAAIAVSGSSVITKIIYMDPDQSDFELESQIEIEADSLIPYPLEEVYVDFEELGPSKTHTGKVNVLLSAAHKDIVDARLTLAREVPFEPEIVDIEGYALGNAIDHFYHGVADQAPICCISIGASLLQVCVWAEGEVIYSKEHMFGVNNLLQDLSIINMIDAKEVESQLVGDTLPANWKQDTLPIFSANLQQQINRALQMYMSTLHAARPEKILLCGGAATLPLLVESLKQDLGLDVEVFNPFAQLVISDQLNKDEVQQLAPLFAIAAGLASRSVD